MTLLAVGECLRHMETLRTEARRTYVPFYVTEPAKGPVLFKAIETFREILPRFQESWQNLQQSCSAIRDAVVAARQHQTAKPGVVEAMGKSGAFAVDVVVAVIGDFIKCAESVASHGSDEELAAFFVGRVAEFEVPQDESKEWCRLFSLWELEIRDAIAVLNAQHNSAGLAPLAIEEAIDALAAWRETAADTKGTEANGKPPQRQAATHAKQPCSRPDGNRTSGSQYIFRREGEQFLVVFGTETDWLPAHAGELHIRQLLSSPGRSLSCSALIGVEQSDTGETERKEQREAMQNCESRMRGLAREIEEARSAGDKETETKLQDEFAAIELEVSRLRGLKGRMRGDSASNSTRVNVRQAIKAVIKRAKEKGLLAFAEHLEQQITTGRECVYEPTDPPIDWRL